MLVLLLNVAIQIKTVVANFRITEKADSIRPLMLRNQHIANSGYFFGIELHLKNYSMEPSKNAREQSRLIDIENNPDENVIIESCTQRLKK